MAFQLLKKTAGSVPMPNRVWACNVSRGSIQICLSRDVAATTTLEAGVRVEAFLGTGSDAGFLKIAKSDAPAARIMGRHQHGHAYMHISARGLGAVYPIKTTDLPFRIESDNSLIIDIRSLQKSAAQLVAA